MEGVLEIIPQCTGSIGVVPKDGAKGSMAGGRSQTHVEIYLPDVCLLCSKNTTGTVVHQ